MEDIIMSNSIKGLLIKDLKLMKNMKQFFLIILLVCIMQIISDNHIFCVYFISIMCSSLILSTLSYDTYENSTTYLFTLPISRKDYVRGKYILIFIVSVLPWIFINILSLSSILIKGNTINIVEYFITTSMALPLAWLLSALEIPVHLKFGQEMNRIAIFVIIGGLSVLIWLSKYVGNIMGIESSDVTNVLSGLNVYIFVALGIALVILFLYLSYRISIKIIEKKQY